MNLALENGQLEPDAPLLPSGVQHQLQARLPTPSSSAGTPLRSLITSGIRPQNKGLPQEPALKESPGSERAGNLPQDTQYRCVK